MNKSETMKIVLIASVMLLLSSLMGYSFIENTSKQLTSETEMHLSEVAQQGANLAETYFEKDLEVLRVLASGMISTNIPIEQKITRLKREVVRQHLHQMGIADVHGQVVTTNDFINDISDMDFFKASITGKEYISGIIANEDDTQNGFVYSVPIRQQGKITGVLFGAYAAEQLSQKLNVSFFDGEGISYIVSDNGRIIISPAIVDSSNNIYELARIENSEQKLASFMKANQNKETGVIRLMLDSHEKFIGYAPIKGINDWSLISIIPSHTVYKQSNNIISQSLIVSISISIAFLFIITYIIMTKRKNDRRLYQLAYIDNLTGIGNYNMFFNECTKVFLNKNGKKYAIIYFDIDNFKIINETFGYTTGNQYLTYVAETMRSHLQHNEPVARFSNDYFAILYEYKDSTQEIVNLVESINRKLSHVHFKDQISIDVTLSTGIYVIQEQDKDVNRALNQVNIARSSIKDQPGVSIAFYNEEIRNKLSEETDMQHDIRIALQENQFQIYYQPKYVLESGIMIGSEALIRWKHPKRGYISPGLFIPMAEKSGIIVEVGRYVFEQVCKDLHEWQEQGIKVQPISINLSRVELYQADLLTFTRKMILKHDIDVRLLEIELTETAALNDLEYTKKIISGFKSIGIKVSMDDFGTGYSSLSCLKSIPIDILKLDRSFLHDIEHDTRSKNIASAIINLAKSLNLIVVSEGVETKEQAAFLNQAGCDIVQGFYFSKPVSKQEYVELIRVLA